MNKMVSWTHPASSGVRRPRQTLECHLVLKSGGWDDLSWGHGGHTLQGLVFGSLVLQRGRQLRKGWALIRLHLSRRPTSLYRQSPKRGNEGLRPACIIGEPLPARELKRSWYYSQGPLGQELSLLLWQGQASDDNQLLLEVILEVKAGNGVVC